MAAFFFASSSEEYRRTANPGLTAFTACTISRRSSDLAVTVTRPRGRKPKRW